MGPKVAKVPTLGISGFPFGSPEESRDKMPFGCGLCGEA